MISEIIIFKMIKHQICIDFVLLIKLNKFYPFFSQILFQSIIY